MIRPVDGGVSTMTTLRDVDDDFAEVRARSHVLVGRVQNTLSITGLIPLAVMARFIASNICIEPTEMPCTLARRAKISPGLSSVAGPLKPPIKLILPPSRIAPKERVRVCPHLCNPHRFDSHAVVAHCWLGGPREELEPPGLSPSSPRPDLASWGLLTRWAGLFRLTRRRCRRADDHHHGAGPLGWSGSVISAARAARHGARVQPYPTLSDMMAPIARRQRRLRSGGPLQFQSSILTPLRVML
jgi:hypothetical protein